MADAHEIQARSEGVPSGDTVEFKGQTFRIAPVVGVMPLISFAQAAEQGVGALDMEGMAAIGDILQDCFIVERACDVCDKCKAGETCPLEDLGDWPRFKRLAIRRKMGGEDLLPLIQQIMEVVNARPIQPRSDSLVGPRTISGSSMESSSSPATPDGLISVDELLRRAETG